MYQSYLSANFWNRFLLLHAASRQVFAVTFDSRNGGVQKRTAARLGRSSEEELQHRKECFHRETQVASQLGLTHAWVHKIDDDAGFGERPTLRQLSDGVVLKKLRDRITAVHIS